MRRGAPVSRKVLTRLGLVRRVLLVLLLVALGATGCGGSGSNPPVASDRPTDLTALDQLREAFVADEGAARLVLLLSPT